MLSILTIVLNGKLFLRQQYEIFSKLTIPWQWVVVEGLALPKRCTSWCRMPPAHLHRDGLSNDGTTEALAEISRHDSRVVHLKMPYAYGKVAMCNAGLDVLARAPGKALIEIDIDEFWTVEQLELIARLLKTRPRTMMEFFCRYFIGRDIIITSENTYGNGYQEWRRAWSWTGRERFLKHEPPLLGRTHWLIPRQETRKLGLVFDHFAYVHPEQLKFKEEFYGMSDALAQWSRLQSAGVASGRVGDYLHWVKDGATFARLEQRAMRPAKIRPDAGIPKRYGFYEMLSWREVYLHFIQPWIDKRRGEAPPK